MERKKLRMLLGIIMMFSFLNLVQFIYFFARVLASGSFSIEEVVVGLFAIQWMWLPSILIIVLIYEILVYKIPFEEKDKSV